MQCRIGGIKRHFLPAPRREHPAIMLKREYFSSQANYRLSFTDDTDEKGVPMKPVIKICFLLGLTLLTACGGNDPVAVADKFWDAMEDRDADEARKYMTRASASNLQIKDSDEKYDIELGKVTENDDDTVSIATTLKKEGGKEAAIQLNTIVVKEEGQWKVDYNQTMLSMFGGAMQQMMQGLGKAMQQGAEGMNKAMQERMDEAAKAVQEAQQKQQ